MSLLCYTSDHHVLTPPPLTREKEVSGRHWNCLTFYKAEKTPDRPRWSFINFCLTSRGKRCTFFWIVNWSVKRCCLLVLLEGVCPKGNGWTSFESRCLYYPKWLKLSYSGAKAACQREGAQLLYNVYTERQRYKVTEQLESGVTPKKDGIWTGIKDLSYHINELGLPMKFSVKPCGSNATLLYDGRLRTSPSCDASHLFVCELQKGKLDCKCGYSGFPEISFVLWERSEA